MSDETVMIERLSEIIAKHEFPTPKEITNKFSNIIKEGATKEEREYAQKVVAYVQNFKTRIIDALNDLAVTGSVEAQVPIIKIGDGKQQDTLIKSTLVEPLQEKGWNVIYDPNRVIVISTKKVT